MARAKDASWHPTGSGSFRKVGEDLYEVRYRPLGTRGPYLKRRIAGTAAEIREMLARTSANRSRRRSGLAVQLGWIEAAALYEAHLDAKSVTADYKKQALDLLDELKASCRLEYVSDVEPSDIELWRQSLVREAKQAGRVGWARTANKKRAMLGAAFRFWFRKRMLSSNPVDATETYPETKRPKRDLKPKEYAKVWQTCEPSVRDLLDFLLVTTARFGEVEKMKLADVDKDGRWTMTDRKGRDFLRLVLPPALRKIVKRQTREKDGLVFHRYVPRKAGSKRGHGWVPGVPIRREWFDALLKERCARANIPPFSAHDLRRAGSQWAREAGMDAWGIKDALGHSQLNTTMLYPTPGPGTGAKVVLKKLLEIRSRAIQSKAV